MQLQTFKKSITVLPLFMFSTLYASFDFSAKDVTTNPDQYYLMEAQALDSIFLFITHRKSFLLPLTCTLLFVLLNKIASR